MNFRRTCYFLAFACLSVRLLWCGNFGEGSATNDMADRSCRNTVMLSQGDLGHAISYLESDGDYVSFTENGVGPFLATFRPSILRVIFPRSQKQVIWPNTRRIVATVQNLHSIWDWAVRQYPRGTMRTDISRRPIVLVNSSIAIFVAQSSPFPAAVALADRFPESFAPVWSPR